MDAFFAAIEQRRRPELLGRRVVIRGHGDPMERGVVSTASYEARKYGIHSAMPLRTAFRLCPQAVFLPVDHEAYAAVAHQIVDILRMVTPQVEALGLDEAFVDISDIPGPAKAIARSFTERIRSATGLTRSVGVAHNKLLAELASDLDKPDGLTTLGPGDQERRIRPLPVRRLWGAGPKTEAKLADLGVRTIGELADLPLATLIQHFGPGHGRELHDSSQGIDETPVVPLSEPKSISREVTFLWDVSKPATVERVLRGLVREAVAQARLAGYRARTVTTRIRFADFQTLTRQTTLDRPTEASSRIERAALACLHRIVLENRVRRVGVRLGGLVPARQRARAGRCCIS
jgi:DNA polymerase IV